MHIQIRISQDGKTFEGEAVLAEVRPEGKAAGRMVQSPKQTHQRKPSGAIDDLYRRGHFATERTLKDVRGQLQKDGYNFGAPSVLMALRSKDYLQRRGSKGSYRFVQKYPPS